MNFRSFRFLILLALAAAIFQPEIRAQKNAKPKKSRDSNAVEQAAPTSKSDATTLEKAVVAELNEARTDPQIYIGYLEEYKKYLNGKLLSLPGRTALQMIEGLPAIEDAILDMKRIRKLDAFEVSGGLSKVARAQLADVLENPTLGHYGKDGSDLERRLLRFGFPGGAVAENISRREDDAKEIVMNMIVDDGFKSRAHRKNVFSTRFKLFGIACGLTRDKTMTCIAEFADAFKER